MYKVGRKLKISSSIYLDLFIFPFLPMKLNIRIKMNYICFKKPYYLLSVFPFFIQFYSIFLCFSAFGYQVLSSLSPSNSKRYLFLLHIESVFTLFKDKVSLHISNPTVVNYFSEIFVRVKKSVTVKWTKPFYCLPILPTSKVFLFNAKVKIISWFFSSKMLFCRLYKKWREMKDVNLYIAEEKTVIRFAY